MTESSSPFAAAFPTAFDPPPSPENNGGVTAFTALSGEEVVYCWQDDIKFAIKVALATGRALLLQGEPGIGKTVVAEAVAAEMRWRFYSFVVSSRTESQDLTWRFDYVRRLADAQANTLPSDGDDSRYILPGPFWWAFAASSASHCGLGGAAAPAKDPGLLEDETEPAGRARKPAGPRNPAGAVILVDEIDKADPAVANDLLETLGAGQFGVEVLGRTRKVLRDQENSNLLVVFTSNAERDLPDAFLRRCIVFDLKWPKPGEAPQTTFDTTLRAIASANWDRIGKVKPPLKGSAEAEALTTELLRLIWLQRADHIKKDIRPPGIAEFLDAIAACRELGVTPGDKSKRFDDLRRLVWEKDRPAAG